MASDDGDMLRQAVFGANDGLVSTFGLVAGLVGAAVSQNVLLIANIVNMFAAGMSMGLGSYLSTKSVLEYHRRLEAQEREKIRTKRKQALAELSQLFRRRGVPSRELKKHVETVTDTEEEWLAFVLQEKYGIGKASFPNPVKGGVVMFCVFVLCGFIPIVPLLFASGVHALIASAFVTAVTLFVVGALKHRLTGRTWLSLGLENLLIGAITGVVGFIAGTYTASLIGHGV